MNKPTYLKACAHCGRRFGSKARNARYCKPRCRQAAYRRRRDPGIGDPIRQAEARYITHFKRRQPHSRIICRQCGTHVTITGYETRRKYCTNACKQRAYRQRKNPALLLRRPPRRYGIPS